MNDEETKQLHIDIQQALARGYCYPKTENKVLDPDLIEAMALEAFLVLHKEIVKRTE